MKKQSQSRAPEMVGVDTAAEYLDVHPITVRRWIAQGRLPAQRVGPRLIRIRVADIERLTAPVGGAA
ncbi:MULTISPECIES: helix-turn-helix domain-containing protein [Mycobacterium]|nr:MULTISPECIES: helix-turn-helix domain-containing protein [Mycobacterium]